MNMNSFMGHGDEQAGHRLRRGRLLRRCGCCFREIRELAEKNPPEFLKIGRVLEGIFLPEGERVLCAYFPQFPRGRADAPPLKFD